MNNNYIKQLFLAFIVASSFMFQSCEDVIDVDLAEGQSQLVVDGFITFYQDSQALQLGIEKQVIKLRKTSGYLDNNPSPAATGAIVKVTDALNRVFEFKDINNDGNYMYEGPFQISFTNPPLGFPGNFYSLYIKYEGEEYNSIARMDSVPTIDSISFEYKEPRIIAGDTTKEGYLARGVFTKDVATGVFSPTKDLKGTNNGYWFKAFNNNVYYNKPRDINLAIDAGFDPSSDGIAFIEPILFNLSPERLAKNDTFRLECWSIGLPNVYFINLAQGQMTNGGLFARPTANVPTNIFNMNKNSKVKALGWFGAAAVSRITQVVE